MKTTFITQHNAASTLNGSHAAHNVYSPLRRLTLLVTLLITFVSEASSAQYVIYNGTYFLAIKNKNSIEATTTFNPATCIWTGPEDGASGPMSIEYNGSTYYLYRSGTSLAVRDQAYTYWNARGNDLYTEVSTFYGSQNYYICYDGGWKNHNQRNNNILYLCSVESSTGGETTKSYAISIGNVVANPTTLDHKGTSTVTVSGGSVTITTTTTSGYNKYTLTPNSRSGDPIVLYSNSSTPVTTTETTDPTGYSWTLSSTDNANLNSNTTATTSNVVTYSTASATTTQVTVEVRASYTVDGTIHQSDAVSTTITLNRVLSNPTSITAEDLTLIVGETGTIAYTLQPPGAYDQVTFDVADESVASIDIHGTVTAKKAGSTQFTVTAYNYDDSEACSTSNTITVAERVKTPIITYVLGATNTTVTITSETEGTAIYYTIDGSNPTTTSSVYEGPFTVATSSLPLTIKAIATKADYIESEVAERLLSKGNGTANDPYIISSASDLDNLATYPSAYFKVVNDFDASGFTGSITNFSGTLDGNYTVIKGLRHPLFNSVNGATIRNVVLDQVNITGGTGNVGAIVGTASGATRIYNCGVLSGSIGGGTNVGSIAGELRGSARVINCYSFADITGGTTVGGIVGNNSVAFTTADALQTLVMNCIYYGELAGTSIYPIFGGKNITNNLGVNTYNFFRHNDATKYAGYNRAQAITEDSYLDRFEFYRHILNSHRELAAYYALGSVSQQEEIGKWTLDKTRAPYPIVTKHLSNTRKTLDRTIPNTQEDYAGKKIKDINVTININGKQVYNGTLPMTDMNRAEWDYTYGKVVLPFANEFTGWSIGDAQAITGWKISTKDYYQDLNATFDNTEYVYAQGGNYIVPEGVESITLTAYVAPAVYLSDASYDVVYNSSYASPQGRGGTTPTTYKGQPVYTDLAAAIDALKLVANTVRPYEQAIVLVGNYHYNQVVESGVLPNAYDYGQFYKNKPFTLMSVDNNNDQEPDYCFYQYHSVGPGRSLIHPVRFDFLTSPGIGMAAHIEEGSAVPGIGIWHCKGWYEQTETYLGIMGECEMRPANFLVESPWILNGGIFEEINVSSTNEYGNQKESKLSYIKIGGNALVNKFYPGVQHANNNSYVTTLKPVYVSGGEVKSCYMTGKQPQYTTTVGNVDFYCNGGYIHEFLGAYMEPLATNATIYVRADHALIDNFYGGGANENYGTPGNINITMNNSRVNFFCGGPKYGNMSDGKTITIEASGSTFGQFYGGGYGGTALTRNMKATSSPDFSGELTYPHDFTNYTDDRLQSRGLGIGVGYDFEFFLYAGGGSNGGGKGVARFFVDYAKLSLATVGSITSKLTNCTILGDYYGGGCQGRVEGDVTSILTDCTVNGNIFAGGYTAAATPCYVYPSTPPTYSTFKSTLGIFTPFGTTTPDKYVWAQATASQAAGTVSGNTIYTDVDMTKMGEVNGNTVITVSGNSYVAGAVYGGGNESKVTGTTTVHINATDRGNRINNVFGGANQADVDGATTVNINSGNIGNVFGANNKSGTKGSTIEVNVKGATSDYVYGAGNLAAYTGNPVVNMSAGTVKNALYGGGLGESAIVTGNPQVNMTGGTVGYTEKVDGKDVVRGGDVFGGGNAAAVQGNTNVHISGGEVKHNVYGGGNQANVTGKTNVVIGQQ